MGWLRHEPSRETTAVSPKAQPRIRAPSIDTTNTTTIIITCNNAHREYQNVSTQRRRNRNPYRRTQHVARIQQAHAKQQTKIPNNIRQNRNRHKRTQSQINYITTKTKITHLLHNCNKKNPADLRSAGLPVPLQLYCFETHSRAVISTLGPLPSWVTIPRPSS